MTCEVTYVIQKTVPNDSGCSIDFGNEDKVTYYCGCKRSDFDLLAVTGQVITYANGSGLSINKIISQKIENIFNKFQRHESSERNIHPIIDSTILMI